MPGGTRVAPVGAILLAYCAVVGCADSTSTGVGVGVSVTSSPADAVRSSGSSGDIEPPIPAGPYYSCGLKSQGDADQVVRGSLSSAVVEVTVTDSPGESDGPDSAVPVINPKLLTGQLPDGPVQSILEASGVPNLFPPGDYLVVVAPEDTNTYLVPTGGIFSLRDGHAYQKCANDTGRGTHLADDGITDPDKLAAMFQIAIDTFTPRSGASQTSAQPNAFQSGATPSK